MINPNNFIDWIMQLNFNLVAKANEIIAKEGKIVRYPLFRVSVKTSSSAMKRANRNNEIFSLFSTAIWMEWRIG